MQIILIKNAQNVNEGKIVIGDIFIKYGRIGKISPSISHISADIEINAEDNLLLGGSYLLSNKGKRFYS